MAPFKIPILLLMNSWTFWYIERLPMSSYAGVAYFQKWSGFFWPTLYVCQICALVVIKSCRMMKAVHVTFSKICTMGVAKFKDRLLLFPRTWPVYVTWVRMQLMQQSELASHLQSETVTDIDSAEMQVYFIVPMFRVTARCFVVSD